MTHAITSFETGAGTTGVEEVFEGVSDNSPKNLFASPPADREIISSVSEA